MGVPRMHHVFLLAVFCALSLPFVSSSCSNLSPCNTKGGTCISKDESCSGKAYTAVRYCAGAGCKCCVDSNSTQCSNLSPCDDKSGTCIPNDYSCHDTAYLADRYCEGHGCKCCTGSYHSPDGGSDHLCTPGRSCGRRGKCERGRSCPTGYERHAGDCGEGDCQCCVEREETCNVGQSCGRRGRCERGGCPHGSRRHAGDCEGEDCECCVRRDDDRNEHCHTSGSSCGIRGTCRDNCWSDEELHSGSCGAKCACCAPKLQWIDQIHGGNCRGSCGRYRVCRPYRCLSGEVERGSCTAGYDCKCCEQPRENVCIESSCNNGQGTCHEKHCPRGKMYLGHCSGHNCVCCSSIVGCPVTGSRCSDNGFCREGSCFVNEYIIGTCGGLSSCVCCVKNQFPACFALGASCLGSGLCRVGSCNTGEIKMGTCGGTDCVCCSQYAQQVCTNVNGPCNNGAGACRPLCLLGETDLGLGSCYGSACRCCQLSVCPSATCISGPMQGTCRPNSCQSLEFDIGECITGQPNCRCCTETLVTCPYHGLKCGQNGTCRSGGCLLGEAVTSGQCGGGYCVCCAPIPPTVVATTTTLTCPQSLGATCGLRGACRIGGCLTGEALHSGECGGGNCFCCATIENASDRVKRQATSEDVATIAEAGAASESKDPNMHDTDNKDKGQATSKDVATNAEDGAASESKDPNMPDTNTKDPANEMSLDQATYVDECKKENVMDEIQLKCTRKQLTGRSGKTLDLDFLHSSEEYGEYLDDIWNIGANYNQHGGDEGIEFYDSIEENLAKENEKYLSRISSIDIEDNVIPETKVSPSIKEDSQKLVEKQEQNIEINLNANK